jgi:adenylate cyclase
MWKTLKQLVGEWGGVLIAAPTVAVTIIAINVAGLLQNWELEALDRFFRWRPFEGQDARVIIVGINEADIRELNQWPASDEKIAELIEKIKQQQPRAIGLDIYRDLPVEPGHDKLVEVFKSTPNLIGIKTVGGTVHGAEVNPPAVLQELYQVGANDLILDPDSIVRRGLLFLEGADGTVETSLGLMLAFIYLDAEGIVPQNSQANPDYLQLGDAVFVRLQKNDGGYVRTYADGYQILINYRGPRGSFQTVSMMDVLAERIPPDLMRDRVVLIGAVAPSLPDVFNTPYNNGLFSAPERMPGVEVHANFTSQIISAALDDRSLFQVWPDYIEWLWIFTGSLMGVLLVKCLPSAPWIAIAVPIAQGMILGSAYSAFLAGWWIPVVSPTLAMGGSVLVMTGYLIQRERQERQMMMNLFGRHVTPKIADAIWRDRHELIEAGQVAPQEMIATVLFTDLKGFSSIAEHMPAKELMPWLNEYMSAMAEIVMAHNGVIDKFIGDAVMAVFGVPFPSTTPEAIATDAMNAVHCALAMAEKLKTLNGQWREQGLPMVAMRVGIATGPVVAGSLGSAMRQDFTIIGDTVNVAARLESFDKSIDGSICRILISEETRRLTQNHHNHSDRLMTKPIGTVLLKGRQQPTRVFQIFTQ